MTLTDTFNLDTYLDDDTAAYIPGWSDADIDAILADLADRDY